MIDIHDFSRMQMELTAEFAKYVVDHPSVEEQIPDNAYVYFEVAGEQEFNRYSRQVAEGKRSKGQPVAVVRVQGLAKPQRSRLLKPQVAVSANNGTGKNRATSRRRAV